MTIVEKIDEVQAAYEVLKRYVQDEEYKAYLWGLLDARQIEIDNTKEKQNATTN